MNVSWQEFEKILDEALVKTIFEVNEEDRIAAELDKAWNRGAKAMLNEALLLFIQKDKGEEKA